MVLIPRYYKHHSWRFVTCLNYGLCGLGSWKQAQKPLSLVSGIVSSTIEFASEQEMICFNRNDDYTRNVSDRVLVVVASLQLDLSLIKLHKIDLAPQVP